MFRSHKDVSLSLCLSPSPPSSLKSIKTYPQVRIKKDFVVLCPIFCPPHPLVQVHCSESQGSPPEKTGQQHSPLLPLTRAERRAGLCLPGWGNPALLSPP